MDIGRGSKKKHVSIGNFGDLLILSRPPTLFGSFMVEQGIVVR